MFFVFLIYFIQTTAELCLSPVGLSAMTRLAPLHLASFIMGAWFYMTVVGQFVAGKIGEATGTDAVELAFLDATNAGISVNASAGNSGPGAATSDHGGPWVTTVGASTGPRTFASTLHLTADGGATLDVPGVTLTNGVSVATPVVLAASLGGGETAACGVDAPAASATGKVVVCARGGNGRVEGEALRCGFHGFRFEVITRRENRLTRMKVRQL